MFFISVLSGNIKLNSKPIQISSAKEALEKYKIGYISEDRKKEGLILMHNVLDNTGITVWSQLKKFFNFLDDSTIGKKVVPYIEKLEVKTPSNYQLTSNLSGGNQQKLQLDTQKAQSNEQLQRDRIQSTEDIATMRANIQREKNQS